MCAVKGLCFEAKYTRKNLIQKMGDWKKCLKERSIFYVKRVTVCKEAIPPQAMINNLEMDEAPFEELNTLELHLISPILLFYKIVLLPKSDQRAVHVQFCV